MGDPPYKYGGGVIPSCRYIISPGIKDNKGDGDKGDGILGGRLW